MKNHQNHQNLERIVMKGKQLVEEEHNVVFVSAGLCCTSMTI